MKRFTIAIFAAAALPLLAQDAANSGDKIVARINGETITQSRLDQMYNALPVQMRSNYDQAGGKPKFLEVYLGKRLLIQEALKSGFDKRPEVQQALESAKESTLFDRYVRDVVASSIVTEQMVREYYDKHPDEFGEPEKVKARQIIIMFNGTGPKPKSKDTAATTIANLAQQLAEKSWKSADADKAKQVKLFEANFIEAAKQYSEDGIASEGGQLGWFNRGMMDPKFDEVAFSTAPGTMSPPFETRFGYHLIFVEDHKPSGRVPYEEARGAIREKMMSEHMAQIMAAVQKYSNDLRKDSNVAIFPDNIP
jgi:EpsD family peptidyl-prolyl cis-trans isomerase